MIKKKSNRANLAKMHEAWTKTSQKRKVDPAILEVGLFVMIEMMAGEAIRCQIIGFWEPTGEWQLKKDRPQDNAQIYYRKSEDIYYIW